MGIASRPAIGANTRITLANEAVQGTVAKSNNLNRRFDFTSESISAEEDVLESATIRDTRNRPRQNRGTLDVSGDLSAEFAPDGYGRMIRHSLGLYSNALADVDGGAHGRMGANTNALTTHFTVGDRFMLFADDYISGFNVGNIVDNGLGGEAALLYRNDADQLVYDDIGGVFYPYEEFRECLKTEVATGSVLVLTNVTPTVTDILTINKGPNGEMFNLLNGATGTVTGEYGVCYLELDGVVRKIGYRAAVDNAPANTFSILISSLDDAIFTALTITDAQPVRAPASLYGNAAAAGLFAGHDDIAKGFGVGQFELGSGTWIYGRWNDHAASDIYTHHHEIGKTLPVGMTVEILRDSVNFLYSGMMVNTFAATFDSQAYVTASWSMIGVQEYSVNELAHEAQVADLAIFLREEPVAANYTAAALSTTTYLTIGNETTLLYEPTGILAPGAVGNPSAVYWYIPITGVGVESIQNTHFIGENVDFNTTAADPGPSIVDAPKFSSFEAVVAQNCDLIEVLSGNFNVNNNLGADKFILGSRFRAAIREARAVVDGTINVEFDDGGHYLNFVKGKTFSLEFRASSEDEDWTIIDGLFHPSEFFAFFPSCKLTGSTPNVGDESYITHDLNFDAFQDTTVVMPTSPIVIIGVNRNLNDGF